MHFIQITVGNYETVCIDNDLLPDVLLDVLLVPPALEVVEEHLPGGEGGDRLPKVFLEGVVGKLEALLRAIGPKVSQKLS